MKIVIAMDSFKGSLSAGAACQAVADGFRSALNAVELKTVPIADGGEGTASAMLAAGHGEWIAATVTGPLPNMRVESGFAWFPKERTAVVEMAAASGLTLISDDRHDPIRATTYGTGELIAAASARGARTILLAVGGSATVDGGVGAASALGWRFLDREGDPVALGGGALERIERIVRPVALHIPEVKVLCDVRNPLTGPEGAANIYGPQKGATPEMVLKLESGLVNLARLVRRQLEIEIETVPGAGAAGGLAAGALAFMGAELTKGIDTVLSALDFDSILQGADWVITGEGSFDMQSLYGKAVSGIAAAALRANTRVAVIAGKVDVDCRAAREAGIDFAIPICKDGIEPEYAIENAATLLEQTAKEFARLHIC